MGNKNFDGFVNEQYTHWYSHKERCEIIESIHLNSQNKQSTRVLIGGQYNWRKTSSLNSFFANLTDFLFKDITKIPWQYTWIILGALMIDVHHSTFQLFSIL